MTKKQLSNYRHLIKEIAKIEKDIKRLQDRQAKIPIVKDKVQASMEDYPYTMMHVTVDAREPLANSTIEMLLAKKTKFLAELQLQRLKIEEYIEHVKDSRSRQVLDMVYIEGKSQQYTAIQLGVDQATISRIIEKTLKDA